MTVLQLGSVDVGDVGPSAFCGLVGIAQRDITPQVGIRNRNWGPASTDVAEGIHRPLTLTAVALATDEGDQVLLIGLDATWWRRASDEAAFRRAVFTALDLDETNVLISLSHTHAGGVLSSADTDLEGGQAAAEYLRRLTDVAVEAGRAALDGRVPATVEWATGRSSIATDRELDVSGRALVGFNPRAVADDTLLVGRISDENGRVMGTIVNYACHPTTLAWENRLISPDYVGALRETVETTTGAPMMFLQGASGDLAPREQYTGDTALADRHGTAIGHAALAALSCLAAPATAVRLTGMVESGASLAMWRSVPREVSRRLAATSVDVELPLQPLPTLAQLEAEWAEIDQRSRAERLRRARQLRDGYIDVEGGQSTVQHRLWIVRIGDAVVVAHPGEAYSAFQVDLRSEFPEHAIAVVNLTNGPGFVYLANAQAYQRKAYQAWQSPLAQDALEIFTNAAVAAVGEILGDA